MNTSLTRTHIARDPRVEQLTVTITAAVFLVIAAIAQWLLIATLPNSNLRPIISTILWVGVLLCIILLLVVKIFRWRGESYSFDKENLYVRHNNGVLGDKEKAYPHDSIAFVSVHKSGLGSSYNIGTVRIQFAKALDYDVILTNVHNPQATYGDIQKRLNDKKIVYVAVDKTSNRSA
jgi:membrane protein YdbS with pleckstrin-like domain